MQQFFTVIGGMGTMATESYIRLLNERTPANRDQDYLNYLIVNHATIPDRTAYILDHNQPSFLPDLLEDVKQQSLLNPNFMVIICNTAHYFYKQLQTATTVPILHMPREAVQHMVRIHPEYQRIGLIATQGTIADHVYEHEIEAVNREVIFGDQDIQEKVSHLIYQDIKEKGVVDATLYHDILNEMMTRMKCDVVVLGCTELSLAQEKAPNHSFPVIDSQSIIVDRSIELAQLNRKRQV